MARHQLTIDEQIAGARKALANPKTPKQFLATHKLRLEQLEKQKAKGSTR